MRKFIEIVEGQDDRVALGERILAFVDKHAMIAAAYDPEYDSPDERFNGPDSAMLCQAGEALKAGVAFPRIHSSYDSGCYTPYTDKAARAEHDEIVKLANQYAG